MGIDFTCDEKSFGCSYGSWHNIRCSILEATFAYLESRFAEILAKPIKEESDDWETTHIQSAANSLQQYINDVREFANSKKQNKNVGIFGIMRDHNHILECFLSRVTELYFVDLLIEFGVGGIYALCNKSDCEGFYSVGNAYDIHELLTTIRPFLLKDRVRFSWISDNWLYDAADDLIDMFQESFEKKKFILIH